MGIVKAADGQLTVTYYPRSSVDTELDDINQMIASVWDLAGVPVTISGRFSGWNPNPNSPILLLMEDVYQEMYGQEPEVTAVHAGLECGTIVSKYPGMDAISIGPTLQDVHTPNERMQVASVKKLNDFLIETLKQIPEKGQGSHLKCHPSLPRSGSRADTPAARASPEYRLPQIIDIPG